MILVTGGTGLVGGHLLFRFRESVIPIKAIYRNPDSIIKTRNLFELLEPGSGHLVEKFNWTEADVNDITEILDAMHDVTQVYHCAALIEATYDELIQTNVQGTTNLVNAALEYKIEKFCYVSSIATLGDVVNNNAITEDDTFNLNTDHTNYAISKYGAEMEVWRASQEGLPVVIVNPGVILGEGNWNKGSGKFFSKIYSGFPFYTTGTTGFVDVRDLVHIMVSLMKSDIVNERFIVVAISSNIKTVLDNIATALKVKKPNIKIHRWMLYLFMMIIAPIRLFSKSLGFEKPVIKSITSQTKFNNTKIVTTLGHNFIELNDTIERCAVAFLKNT